MFALILDPCSKRMRSVPPLAFRVGTEVELEIDGTVAIVTGGGRRIGRAVALGLGEAGARVAVHYHTSEARAKDVVELIKSSGSDAITLQTDLTSHRETSLLVEAAASHLGPVQILINNASMFEKTNVVDYRQLLEYNHPCLAALWIKLVPEPLVKIPTSFYKHIIKYF